jgi:XTP/dITP diphosphohydrolase
MCEGTILHKPAGTGGFGYDPVFRPDGYSESFAQMDASLKNRISHRAIALRQLKDFLLANRG